MRWDEHTWELDGSMPANVANARVAHALLLCVRRLPRAWQGDDTDLARTIGPAFETLQQPLAARVRELVARHDDLRRAWSDVDLGTDGWLRGHEARAALGGAVARGDARFRPLVDQALQVLERFIARHPHPADRNLQQLQSLMGLPPAALAFIRLATAVSHGDIDRGDFRFVNSSARLARVLPALCDAAPSEVARLFDPGQPLADANLLVALSTERKQRDLEDLLMLTVAGERMLCGTFADAREMAGVVLKPLVPPPPERPPLRWPHLSLQRTLLAAVLQDSLQARTPGINLLIHGGPGTGKTEFVRDLLARELGVTAYLVDCQSAQQGREATRADRLASLRLAQRFAGDDTPAVIVLDEAEDIFQGDHGSPFGRALGNGQESKAWVNELLEGNRHPVVWITNAVDHMDPAYLRRFAACLEFPATPYGVRRELAQASLVAEGCSPALADAVAAAPEMTPALLASTARVVRMTAGSALTPDTAARLHVEQQLRVLGRQTPFSVPPRGTRFDLDYLHVQGNATPARVLQALQRQPRAALLLSGPPGSGKTQFAQEIAQQLDRQLVVRTASDLNSKWFGQSEANVAAMFRGCDPGAEILFLDEAETLLASRTAGSHRVERAVTAEFLRWLELFEGTFVCATNHAQLFDAALTRRFTWRLQFQPMTPQQRRRLFAELALERGPANTGRLPAALARRLDALDALTPGDFANVRRRIEALGLPRRAWIEELEAEQQAKPGGSGRPMGFV